MKTKLKPITFLSLFLFVFCHSQKLTQEQLMSIWSIEDKSQTQEVIKTYEDLVNHYDPKKYEALILGFRNNPKIKEDTRLHVRSILYQANGKALLEEKFDSQLEKELKSSIKSALILNDEQLLSEVYSLYFEQGFGDSNEKLYYISKTVEIQEKIGTQYFPRLFFRYYNLSLGYYRSQDYIGSIQKGLKGLKLIKNPNEYLDYYVFLLDILGSSYYEIGKYDKSLEY